MLDGLNTVDWAAAPRDRWVWLVGMLADGHHAVGEACRIRHPADVSPRRGPKDRLGAPDRGQLGLSREE
jgi:hypothetical protein